MSTRAAAKREAAFLAGASLPSSPAKKRKRVSRTKEPVKGGWDTLPHGMGKKGDLEDGSLEVQAKKRTRMSEPAKEEPVKEEPVKEEIKDDTAMDDLEVIVRTQKKKRASRKDISVDKSNDVLQKVDELDISAKVKKTRKGKTNPYGLTPGYSPFPDLVKPTPEDCEEVTRLLSELHGEVKAPEVIPPPSMEVTGCGEVPDILDAILRTLLSATTTSNNSNMALKGLKDKFGLRTSGVGVGSVNWEAVHAADLGSVIESIKKGGLAKVKGTNIKKILNTVWEQNVTRRDALVKEEETGKPAAITAAAHESQTAKDQEISKVEHGMLSMDHIFEMTTDEAMTELTKLPGIGVKTASCVILFCMKRPSFAVDTHVWRHCKWLSWVPPNATRDQTFSHCEVRIPDHLKYPLHQLFIRHGKTCGRCRAATSAGSEEWENTVCPIDHLVSRTEAKKMPGAKSNSGSKKPAKKTKKGKKSKKAEDTESEVEMSENEETEDAEEDKRDGGNEESELSEIDDDE